MKPIRFIVVLTTLYLLVYTLAINFTVIPAFVAIALWIMGHVLVVYMVLRVLRKGVPSERTFDEGYWYEDRGRMTDG